MATVDNVQSNGNLQLQQNIPFRSRSPSSPLVLSRPTTSRRKPSLSSSEFRKYQIGTSPPKQQVVMRGSLAYQQHISGSSTMNPRPIHSMYSASQPHLNTEEFDVKYRSRSHTVSTYDRRNRWSTADIGENHENNFNSGSIGKGYDLCLTKRSVEDLRPLPVPVVAPRVPPRRGSRLSTVSNPRYRENVKVEAPNKTYRETRSCEDLLETVSTEELKLVKVEKPKLNGHYDAGPLLKNDADAMIQAQEQHYQTPSQTNHNLTQFQPSLRAHSTATNMREAQPVHLSSQEKNPTITSHSPHQSGFSEVSQATKMPAMPAGSHSGTGVSYANEVENMQVISNHSREPYLTSSQWTPTQDRVNAHFAGQSVANANVSYNSQQSQQLIHNTQVGVVNSGIRAMNTEHVAGVSVGTSGYQRNTSVIAPHSSLSTEYTYTSHHGSVRDSACSSGAGVSSIVSQQSSSSPPPPIDMVNDANLSMTPQTSCSSPSPSPQVYGVNNETVVINIPQPYHSNQENNLATTNHVPHYAIPTNSSHRHKQDQATTANSEVVQSLTMVRGGPHSYMPGLDHPLINPSNCEFYQSQPQDLHSKQNRQVAMASKGISAHTSHSQPTATLCETNTVQKGSVEAGSQSQGASQKTQALAQAFSQWQYHDTAKRKQVSSKQHVRSESKPPVKPKPASLMKGGSMSLKRDKNKSQKSAEVSTVTKKSGQKYVFKQSQSRTLLAHGRTPSQVDPLTDVGMDIQYGNYTPHKYHQSSSGSSSDSTLRDDFRFTESQYRFASSGPSPNSYDYGSQMTLTGDATLTPYSPTNEFHLPTTLYHQLVHSTSGTNTIQTCASATHTKPASPHPCANNSYSQLPLTVSSHNQTLISSSISPSEFKTTSALAPIAEVNVENELSNSNLLNTTEQTDSSHYRAEDGNLTKNLSYDNASNNQTGSSGNSPTSGITSTQEGEEKPSPIVHRSSTLPSAYKRPKPYRFNPKKYVSVDIQGEGDESTDHETDFSSSSMKLSDFTALNTSVFPKHVRISNPFMYTSGDTKLFQGVILDLHFVRQTKAVVLVSSKGEEYVVPLNSAIRFALTYDPLNTGQLIHQGYHFKSVGELIAMRQIPTVVIATEGYSDPKPQSSVEAGEILVICGLVKQAHGTALKVNSTTHGRKVLEDRCTANFSTRSEYTKLSLNDMFKTSMQLPQQAFTFPPSGLQLPECLIDAPVTLKQFCVIKSVIATPSGEGYSQPSSSTPSVVYDINLNLDIEIQECSEVVDKQLIEMRAKTQHLYSSFEPTKIIPFYNHTLEYKEQLATQTALLTNIDLKGKFLGMQLELPEWLGQIRISKAKRAIAQSQRESLSQPLLSHDDPGSYLGQPHDFKGGAMSIPFQCSTFVHNTYSTIEQRMVAMEKHCKRMDNKLNTLVRSFTEVVKQLSIIKQKQRQQQTDSESYQGHNQYVDMMLKLEDPSVPVSSSPSNNHDQPDAKGNMRSETQQMRQQLTIDDEQFEAVKEWQRKQEKHLQWQEEQVQQWQIECEKQMQVMQEKLIRLDDRQMKFFLETQQKVKQWKTEQEMKIGGATSDSKKPLAVKQESNDCKKQVDISEKPQLLPNPTVEPVKNDTGVTAAPTPVKNTMRKDTKPDSPDEQDGNTETADVGLDMIADNIASWCSQMELELNELYSNSVESNQ